MRAKSGWWRQGLAVVACLLAAILSMTGQAWAEELTLSVSTSRVEIQSNFSGVDLVLFGGIQHGPDALLHPRYDIALTIRGPSGPLDVRQKERKMGLWINSGRLRLPDVPSFLVLASTRPLPEIATTETLAQFRLSLDGAMDPTRAGADDVALAPYREAALRLKTQTGLYREAPHGVIFLNDTMFRATIPLPPNVPLGTYQVEARLLGDGKVLTGQRASLEVVKTGFENDVAAWARQLPAAYGLSTCLMALVFGWVATVIFRRD